MNMKAQHEHMSQEAENRREKNTIEVGDVAGTDPFGLYARRYPSNTKWRGFLSDLAIYELELAGNTVRRMGDHYVLNSTAPRNEIKATLIGTVQTVSGVL